jgi:hypothetical protein
MHQPGDLRQSDAPANVIGFPSEEMAACEPFRPFGATLLHAALECMDQSQRYGIPAHCKERFADNNWLVLCFHLWAARLAAHGEGYVER